MLHDLKQWKLLGEHVTLLSKRRAQLKRVQERIIQLTAGWVDETPDEATKRELIEVVRAVSAGKVSLESDCAAQFLCSSHCGLSVRVSRCLLNLSVRD